MTIEEITEYLNTQFKDFGLTARKVGAMSVITVPVSTGYEAQLTYYTSKDKLKLVIDGKSILLVPSTLTADTLHKAMFTLALDSNVPSTVLKLFTK